MLYNKSELAAGPAPQAKYPEETLCLVSLLDTSHLIRNYFSKVEVTVIKNRLKVARKSDTYALANELLSFAEAIVTIAIASSVATINNVNTFM